VTGNYSGQEWEVDLDRNDQTRIVAGCELLMLRELAPLFRTTTAVAVPGNHTRNAKDYDTGEHDVADMASFTWAASMLTYAGEADRWGITFVMPEKSHGTLLARVEVAGTRLLYAHGHKTKGGAQNLRKWWTDVSFSRWGDADATDHLITGHRHHVHIEECSEDRWLFVCPTLGGPSTWFHDGGGPTSGHGVLHYVTSDRSVRLVDIAGARPPRGAAASPTPEES
jgi:predicted phosphodiesterase